MINSFDFSAEKQAAWTEALDAAEPGTIVLSWGVPSGRSAGCASWVEAPLQDELRRSYELRYANAHHSRVQVWERTRG